MGPAVDVLVVEDQEPLLKLMRWFLEDEGISVASANDGLDAVGKVQHLRPRLVVFNTQSVAGLKRGWIAALRREADEIRVIDLWSPVASEQNASPDTGADAYLKAPIDGGSFLYCVQELIGR